MLYNINKEKSAFSTDPGLQRPHTGGLPRAQIADGQCLDIDIDGWGR